MGRDTKHMNTIHIDRNRFRVIAINAKSGLYRMEA